MLFHSRDVILKHFLGLLCYFTEGMLSSVTPLSLLCYSREGVLSSVIPKFVVLFNGRTVLLLC